MKPGYVRIKGAINKTISFDELYSFTEDAKQRLRDEEIKGNIKFYCACRDDKALELHMAKNLFLRVAQNGQQDQHADNCPKSIVYEQNMRQMLDTRVYSDYDEYSTEKGIFRMSFPALWEKDEDYEPIPTGKKRKIKPRTKKTPMLDMFIYLNIRAWTLQQYSIKKKIRDAIAEQKKPEWEYKSFADFQKLFFANTHNVNVEISKNVVPLYDLIYKKSTFYESANTDQYIICAKVISVSPYKEDRKYQYVTLEMPSKMSAYKAAVRIPTKKYDKMKDILEKPIDGAYTLLFGWVFHSLRIDENNKENDWIHMTRGCAVYVAKNGLYAVTKEEVKLINELCRRKKLFTRPLYPQLSYGGNMATVEIERLNGKNILIDIPHSSKDFNARTELVKDNPEYDIHIYKKASDVDYSILDNKRKEG